jgi:hypothetical protein
LKSLFGVSTISDIYSLYDTRNELQSSNSDIVHSLTNQVTYVKNLDTVTKVNGNTIANLSTIVKIIMAQSCGQGESAGPYRGHRAAEGLHWWSFGRLQLFPRGDKCGV